MTAPRKLLTGAVLQSRVPRSPVPSRHAPMGLLMRAVVTATYVTDDDGHPYSEVGENGLSKAVYCDVLCYSSRSGLRYFPLQTVLVTQPRGGLHDGRIWKPRATKIDVTGTLSVSGGSRPENMDGDHVLVGFIDDLFNQPVILGGIPHPKADVGNTESGKTLRLKVEDGDPDFLKHHGSLYGIKDNGDFLVDTRTANDGTHDGAGHEPEAPTDGKGTVHFRLPDGATFEIEVDGDTTKHPALAEYLESLYGSLKSYIEGATVPTSMGPSGTIQTGSGSAPSWDSKINSTKVSIPDEE